MWIHNECSFIAETQYKTVKNKNYSWICPKCEFFNFSDSFFGEQVNLETENRFFPLTKEKKDRSSPCGTKKSSFISGLEFISMNINSIRGKKLELLAFLDFHQPHVVAIQETKIDSSVTTSELFPETCPYSEYRKDRNIHGWVMLLVHKDISHMPITELENHSESIWVKVFTNKTLEGTDLKYVESIKYLGVTITSDLRWNTHVSNVCTKANRTLGFLRRNLYSCPQEVKEAAYKGLVRPVLDYGSLVWV